MMTNGQLMLAALTHAVQVGPTTQSARSEVVGVEVGEHEGDATATAEDLVRALAPLLEACTTSDRRRASRTRYLAEPAPTSTDTSERNSNSRRVQRADLERAACAGSGRLACPARVGLIVLPGETSVAGWAKPRSSR